MGAEKATIDGFDFGDALFLFAKNKLVWRITSTGRSQVWNFCRPFPWKLSETRELAE